jgi:uncharacterized protein (DUF1810 family)
MKQGANSVEMIDSDLAPFHEAQGPVMHQVTEEIIAGRKRTHWMWFIFPQLAGLGSSLTSQRYAIKNVEEARRYLMLRHTDKSALDILGSPDDLKFHSCLTLFSEAASEPSDRDLFEQGLDHFYEGRPDPITQRML